MFETLNTKKKIWINEDANPTIRKHARNFLTLLLNSITNPYEKIMGGSSSITYRDDIDKLIKLGSHDLELYKEKFSKSIRFGLNLLGSNHPGTKVSIAPTKGVDLSQYKKMPWNVEDQTALNDIITQVNKTIVKLNNKNTKIPLTSAMVHRCQGHGRWTHRYHHLNDMVAISHEH